MLNGKIGLLPGQVAGHVHLLEPRLVALPAEMHDEIGGGSDDVGNAGDQIAPAVAVIVDRVLEIVRRQELGLAEFAGPRADHFLGRQVAAVDDAHRIHELGAEHDRAPAIVGQRRERAQNGQLADDGAVVALERPEGGDHGTGHAVLLLDLGEQVAMLFQAGDAVLDAVLRNQLVGEGEEALGKEALLAVAADDARVHRHAVQDAGDGSPRDAAIERFLAESLRATLRSCRCCGRWAGWRADRAIARGPCARMAHTATLAAVRNTLLDCMKVVR